MDSETSESQETNSTSLAEDALNISFEDIRYSVRDGFLAKGFRRTPKEILRGLSGSFNAGELTLIMGQSGAGKSTLMDILAGYTKPTSGKIHINGHTRNEKTFRRRSSYILQDAEMWDMFTVQESLKFAAEFKLGDHVNPQQKQKRVNEVITSLGLFKKQKTKACNLSGGEKKRLSIGLELISDSSVMFLDEPTSGLDSSMSQQIVYLLRLLARQGRAMVVTIHQPSAALLQMVDRLYVVEGGRCAYMGSVPNLLPYIEAINLECPPYHSPVDFLIELCADKAHELVTTSNNGRSLQWTTTISPETDRIFKDGFHQYNQYKFNDIYLSSLPPPKEDPTSKVIRALKSTYPTSFMRQFSTLTRRSFLTIWRDPRFTMTITGIHCSMALFVGTLFYNIGHTAENINNNYNFLYFSLMFLMFTAFSAVTINFPAQIPVARREHFNRWYTSGAYYSSTLVSSLATQTVCTVTYAFIAYLMTGQPHELFRFSLFIVILLLVSYVALCVGLLNGSIFNVKNGVVFGPFVIMPFTIFSGFFLLYKDAPFLLRWMFHASFLKHGLAGLGLAIFGMGREKLVCTAAYCHFKQPLTYLDHRGMAHETFTVAIPSLFVIAAVIIALSYVILKIRLKCKW